MPNHRLASRSWTELFQSCFNSPREKLFNKKQKSPTKSNENCSITDADFFNKKSHQSNNFRKKNIAFAYMLAVKKKLILPCLIETYLAFEAATKLACGKESSNENSSSLVTELDLVLRTARDPMGAKYWPLKSRRAI